jgi:uncharacterized protein YecT (DUF1311 family)
MPQFDLSALEGQELRRLLDSARRQGQAAQTYEILREMDARRARGDRPRTLFPRRLRAAPRTIVLELGDPLESREELWADLEPEPMDHSRADEATPPLRLGEPPVPPPAARNPKARGWAHWAALIFAIGLAGGVAGGWWAASVTRQEVPPPAAPTLAQVAAAPLPSSPEAAAAPDATAISQETLVPTPPPPPPPSSEVAAERPQAAPDAAQPIPETTRANSELARPAVAAPDAAPAEAPPAARLATSATAESKGCGAQPTPADRTICGEPRLLRLQGELRQVYAEALSAHQDRALLRQRQLAWRDARSEVSDPEQLARLYGERIAKLKAATADAIRQQR